MKLNKWLNYALTVSVIFLLCQCILYGNKLMRGNLPDKLQESVQNLEAYGFKADTYLEVSPVVKKKKDTLSFPTLSNDVKRPLIQTVGDQDEILGLVHLGLLEVRTSREQNLDRIQKEVIPSITKITMEDYYGSGVVLAVEEGHVMIVSNQHLLKEGIDAEVTFYDGTKVQGQVIGLSDEYDVGFLKVPLNGISLELLKNIRYASLEDTCYYAMKQGDEVMLIGSADGTANSIYTGTIGSMLYYIEDFDAYMLYNYCYAKPGMSGGGTFDAHGHYIGMITGGNGSESVSLPLPFILQEYEKITGGTLEFLLQ